MDKKGGLDFGNGLIIPTYYIKSDYSLSDIEKLLKGITIENPMDEIDFNLLDK